MSVTADYYSLLGPAELEMQCCIGLAIKSSTIDILNAHLLPNVESWVKKKKLRSSLDFKYLIPHSNQI